MTNMANATNPGDFPGWSKPVLGMLLLLSLLVPWPTTAGGLDRYHDFLDGIPALALEDLGQNVRSLQDYRGQVVLINFWASWCGPCVIEIPSLERLQQAMTGKPFAILAINVGESRSKVWNFAARFNLTFPLLLDNDGRTAADWLVTFYPTTYLVDRQGTVQYVAYGPRNWDTPEMIQAIEEMLEISPSHDQQLTSETGPEPGSPRDNTP
jgi:thiol-disulfide isomerase/thioredoxin